MTVPMAKPIVEYERDVRVGGNHLANVLIGCGMFPSEWRNAIYDEVLERFGQPTADIWVAWKAVMNWAEACDRMNPSEHAPIIVQLS